MTSCSVQTIGASSNTVETTGGGATLPLPFEETMNILIRDIPEPLNAAIAALVQAQRESRILDKDIISLDLRHPGRIYVRLSEEAASQRAESLARKAKPKGGQT